MGILQRLLDAIGFAKPQCKVLCVGLDNSGKSTVIQHLKPKQVGTDMCAGVHSTLPHLRAFCVPPSCNFWRGVALLGAAAEQVPRQGLVAADGAFICCVLCRTRLKR